MKGYIDPKLLDLICRDENKELLELLENWNEKKKKKLKWEKQQIKHLDTKWCYLGYKMSYMSNINI